MNLIHIA